MIIISYTIEEAVEKYYPVAQKMAKGDDDLQQELMLWVIDHLCHKNDVNERYIIQRMHLHVKAYKRGYLMLNGYGRSIDHGDPTGRPHNYTLVDYVEMNEYCGSNVIEADLDMMYARNSNPERGAQFRCDYEKFLASLTPKERKYLDAKLQGMTWTEINDMRIVPNNDQHRLKMSIKEKIQKYF